MPESTNLCSAPVRHYLAMLRDNKLPAVRRCEHADASTSQYQCYGHTPCLEILPAACDRCTHGLCITRGIAVYNGIPFIRRSITAANRYSILNRSAIYSSSKKDMEFRLLEDMPEVCFKMCQMLVRDCKGHLFKRESRIMYITPQGQSLEPETGVWYANYPIIGSTRGADSWEYFTRDYETRKE